MIDVFSVAVAIRYSHDVAVSKRGLWIGDEMGFVGNEMLGGKVKHGRHKKSVVIGL